MKSSTKNIFLYIMSFAIVVVIVMFVVTETEQRPVNGDKASTAYLDKEQEGILIVGDEEEMSSEEFLYVVTTAEEVMTEEEVTTTSKDCIEELITSYFEAIHTCDIEKLNSIVDSNEKVSEEILNKKAEYIEEYTNFTYYLKSGVVDKTYFVYVVYEMKLRGIEVAVPAIERFYVKENSDGVMYISKIPLDGNAADYLDKVEKQEVVVMLRRNVEDRYADVCLIEERLTELEDIIKKSIWVSK